MMKDGMSRRGVLRGGAALAGGTAIGATTLGAPARAARRTLRARRLKPGDTVRIVAPAGPVDSKVTRGQQILEEMGLVVDYGKHVYDKHPSGFLAGADADRLADLNDALRDPKVRGIIGARGGYGSQRIIDDIDLKAVRADPKIFVGFSDLTAVHNRLLRATGLISFCGPMAVWVDTRLGPDSAAALKAALMTTDDIVLTRDPAETSAAVKITGRKGSTAHGPLIGGNLTMMDEDLATDGAARLDGAILLLEETGESPYKYDRMLTHLRRSGALNGIAGVALGQFTNSDGTPAPAIVADVVTERLQGLGVPVLGGLRIGHGKGQLTVPIGAAATIDVEAGTLTVEAGVG